MKCIPTNMSAREGRGDRGAKLNRALTSLAEIEPGCKCVTD